MSVHPGSQVVYAHQQPAGPPGHYEQQGEREPLVYPADDSSLQRAEEEEKKKKSCCLITTIIIVVSMVLVLGLALLLLYLFVWNKEAEPEWNNLAGQQERVQINLKPPRKVDENYDPAFDPKTQRMTSMTLNGQPFSLLDEEKRKQAVSQYQTKGYAFIQPEDFSQQQDPAEGAPQQATSFRKLLENWPADKLRTLPDSTTWRTLVTQKIVEKLTPSAPNLNQEETNLSHKIWNEQLTYAAKVANLDQTAKDGVNGWQAPSASLEKDAAANRKSFRALFDKLQTAVAAANLKRATVIVDSRHRSATAKIVVNGIVPLTFVHTDVTMQGLSEEVKPFWKLLPDLPNMSYGGRFSVLGYFSVLLASGLQAPLLKPLLESGDLVNDVAKATCNLTDSDLEHVAKYVAPTPHVVGAHSTPTVRSHPTDRVIAVGYLTLLGRWEKGALPTSQTAAAFVEELETLFRRIARRINVLNSTLPAWGRGFGDAVFAMAPDWSTVEAFFTKLLDGNLLKEHTLAKWGCFWSRVRVHDAYNLWMNVTRPADKDLSKPFAIKYPLAVLDPSSIPLNATGAHSQRFLNEDELSQGQADNMKWYVRPGMEFAETLLFSTFNVYHTAVTDITNMGTERESIETRVLSVDYCTLPVRASSEIRLTCWGSRGV
ncbi:unnamed protein product [Amoebophrya sp. A120]|nr:unnamed protein product [Amoebophrya sp. A120]|eukprot:GSA120T00021915001.1